MSFSEFIQGFAGGWGDPLYASRVMELRAKQQEEQAKRQAEAEKQQRFASALERMSGGAGGSNYQSALNELAMSDPRFATLAVENLKPMSPLDDLQLQKNRLEVENMQGERDQKAASENAARRALGIGGNQQTPNFNPALGNQVQPSNPAGQGMSDNSALSQLGIPMADNINSRSSENLGLPNPTDIQAMAQQLLQARTQGAPVAPVTRETLAPMAAPPTEIMQQPVTQTAAQPAATAPRITTPEEWAARPENQPMVALGPVEAAKGYSEFVKREQENAASMAGEQRRLENTAPTESQGKAAGFVNRMIEVETKLQQLGSTAQGGRTGAAGIAEQTLSALPLGAFGDRLGAGLVKLASTPEEQVYLKNAEDWIRAKLRKESGAVIGAEEAAAEYASYFPMPGDAPETIADKAVRRQLAIESMMLESGRVNIPAAERAISTSVGNVTFRRISD